MIFINLEDLNLPEDVLKISPMAVQLKNEDKLNCPNTIIVLYQFGRLVYGATVGYVSKNDNPRYPYKIIFGDNNEIFVMDWNLTVRMCGNHFCTMATVGNGMVYHTSNWLS